MVKKNLAQQVNGGGGGGNSRNDQDFEERKFLEILNQTANQGIGTTSMSGIHTISVDPRGTRDDSLELSPPSTMKKDITSASAKKLQVHVPPLKTNGIVA